MQGGQLVLGGGSDALRDGELKVAPLVVRRGGRRIDWMIG